MLPWLGEEKMPKHLMSKGKIDSVQLCLRTTTRIALARGNLHITRIAYKGMILSPCFSFFTEARYSNSRHFNGAAKMATELRLNDI